MIDHFQLGANILLLDVLVVLVFSNDIGTELVTIESTIETTRRGGSCRYRRCRCRTLLYLPYIFRLRTETIWATICILIIHVNTYLMFYIELFISQEISFTYSNYLHHNVYCYINVYSTQ